MSLGAVSILFIVVALFSRFGTPCDVIASDGEGIEVAQRADHPLDPPIDDDRHFLLAEPAMRSERLLQSREVMLAAAGSDHLRSIGAAGDDDEIADPVGRPPEAR